jgi:hypothetical protein
MLEAPSLSMATRLISSPDRGELSGAFSEASLSASDLDRDPSGLGTLLRVVL